ncbi:phage holin family protein [Limosilactobacillus fermentum]|uniref:phage holin family protein n=1 Tax=Limosilactobacillus fermentum TaxID=1613 RepID=UPI00209BDB05|nr:phage holin family protein [Limosilactobacillus fermentum]
MGFLKNIIIDAILFVALAGLFANTGWFYVTSVWTALVAAIVLAILNALIKPILVFLSLPITILTLGLFSIVINGLMLQLTAASFVGPGIHFSSFWAAMLIALIMSICNTIISNHFANQ